MYKKLSLDELSKLQTSFFERLQSLYKRERCQMLKEYLKIAFKDGDDIYYFREGNAYFRLSRKSDDCIIFADEGEKIELHAGVDEINQLHNLLKAEKKLSKEIKSNLSIRDILEEEFKDGERKTINGKPYIVYDIETENVTSNNIATHKFTIAYALMSDSGEYKLITETNMKKFTDFLLGFDGYIIGFNHIGYDNPVLCYNTGYGKEEIEQLDAKSIDLFLFVRQLMQRRMSLNKLGAALVGAKKTLESGLEGVALWKKYKEEGDQKAYTQFKKYCKNDVTMTHLILLYFLKYQKLSGEEGEEVSFDEGKLLSLGQKQTQGNMEETIQLSMFT